jgi:hypothetical protein
LGGVQKIVFKGGVVLVKFVGQFPPQGGGQSVGANGIVGVLVRQGAKFGLGFGVVQIVERR